MEFKKYQHVERFGKKETQGIEKGTVYIFPKLDGTNGVVWFDGIDVKAGSRNRELGLGKEDNQGFYQHILSNKELYLPFFTVLPNATLYGEWLCLSGDTIIRKTSGGKNSNYMTLREMYAFSQKKIVDNLKWTNKDGTLKTTIAERTKTWWGKNGYPSLFSLYQDEDIIKPNRMTNIIFSGNKIVYQITTRKGFNIKASAEHPFLTPTGFKALFELKINDCVAVSYLSNRSKVKRSYGKGTRQILALQREYKKIIGKCEICENKTCLELHHKDSDHTNNTIENFQIVCSECHDKLHANVQKFFGVEYTYEFDKIISIEEIGVEDCYDITMSGEENESNFIANGFVVHNCPHTIKTYKSDAWNKFYVFDVMLNDCYIEYDTYQLTLEKLGIPYIPLIAKVNDYKGDFSEFLPQADFLLESGQTEGIVIKNYNYTDPYGRVTWGKVLNESFSLVKGQKVQKVVPAYNPEREQQIVDELVTEHFVKKEYAKLIAQLGEGVKGIQGQLLRVVNKTLIDEEGSFIIEKYGENVDFKLINKFTTLKVKQVLPELF